LISERDSIADFPQQLANGRRRREYLNEVSPSEERLYHLEVAEHCDLRVAFKGFSEQRQRPLAIPWSGAID
jgi:hypothetical protein